MFDFRDLHLLQIGSLTDVTLLSVLSGEMAVIFSETNLAKPILHAVVQKALHHRPHKTGALHFPPSKYASPRYP